MIQTTHGGSNKPQGHGNRGQSRLGRSRNSFGGKTSNQAPKPKENSVKGGKDLQTESKGNNSKLLTNIIPVMALLPVIKFIEPAP